MKPSFDERELRKLLGDVARRDAAALAPDDDLLATLDIDSLTALRLLAAVEKRYDIRFRDQQLSELRTLGGLLEAIAAALEEKPT